VRAGWHDKGQWGAYSLDGGKSWGAIRIHAQGQGRGSIHGFRRRRGFPVGAQGGTRCLFQGPRRDWARAEGIPDAEPVPDWAPVHFRPAADRVNPKKLYVLDAKGGQAYASADGGAHFTRRPGGLPSLPDYQLSSGSAQATPGIEGDVWLTTSKSSITRPIRERPTWPSTA